MYDSITGYLYEGEQFTLRSDKFFDGVGNRGVEGKFSVKTRFVSSLRSKIIKDKKYYPVISLAEINMGSIKNGDKRKVRRIELQTSLPKSCFETSKYEIGFEDYNLAVQKNLEYLEMAGISTTTEKLKSIIIAKLATPKSIILPHYFGEAGQIIRRLLLFNHKPRSKFRYTQYDEGDKGMSINFSNDIRQDCWYCKYGEIIANGYTLEEEEIKQQVLDGKQRRDILRFEPSFTKQQTLEAVLRRLIPDKKNNFTLNDIFTNGNISQKIILEEFDKIFTPLNVFLIGTAEMQNNMLDYLVSLEGLDFDERALLYYMVNIGIKFGINELWKRLKSDLKHTKYYNTRKLALKAEELAGKIKDFKQPAQGLAEFLRGEVERFELIKPEQKQIKNVNSFNRLQKLL